MSKSISNIGGREFISLMALLMSLVALSIDAMLPALSQIGADLGVRNPNDNQLIVSIVFLGMGLGLMFYGPLSDSYGRKNSIYLGISIFLIGNLISLASTNLAVMLIGRFLQGFGSASCRVVSMAMIRDKFEGPEMGRVMSLIIVIFIMVPALAPSVGQAILLFAEWRAIFGFIIIFGLSGLLWLRFRQPETLAKDKRLDFSISTIGAGIMETLKHRAARAYTLGAGIIFGAFVGYLSSAQQILQIQYKLGDSFSIYFGALALAIGLSSFANSKLVMKFRMENLCLLSLVVLSTASLLFFFYSRSFAGYPDLVALMGYLAIVFFVFGILFGNFNTLAVQHLGHIAGVAASVVGSVTTLLATAIGGIIGRYYDETVQPLILGFLICGVLTLAMTFRVRNFNVRIEE